MPIPHSCFTCGKRNISNLYPKYLDLLNTYRETPDGDKAPEFCALRDLKIWKLCCRKMFISTHCIDDLIL